MGFQDDLFDLEDFIKDTPHHETYRRMMEELSEAETNYSKKTEEHT